MKRKRNAGRADPLPEVGDRFHIWRGGNPTRGDFHQAPMFTFFPAARRVTGELPWSVEGKEHGDPLEEDVFFIGSTDSSYDEAVKQVIADANIHMGALEPGVYIGDYFFPDYSFELEGRTVEVDEKYWKDYGGPTKILLDQNGIECR